VTDRLRRLWDVEDLDGTEERFRAALEKEQGPGRAEVLTQLARVEGMCGRFEEGEALLRQAEELGGDSAVARARILLERGRLLRSEGDPAAARPLFEQAVDVALKAREDFIGVDAIHMAAIVAPTLDQAIAWTERGVEVATGSGDAEYWLGPLLNNLGWAHYEAGDPEAALEAFAQALDARLRDPERSYEIAIARYAVAKALRALDRPAEAAAQSEQAVRWAEENDKRDGWFHEELGEDYAALGRDEDAADQARLALQLLREQDPSLAEDPDRLARLEQLAEEA
jgi:tetratricopeptide (TPR) repeat protein